MLLSRRFIRAAATESRNTDTTVIATYVMIKVTSRSPDSSFKILADINRATRGRKAVITPVIAVRLMKPGLTSRMTL
jgi:hypothetical protein